MRWQSEALTKKDEGNTRIRRKFFLWPRKFDNTWYWLEYAEEVYDILYEIFGERG